MKKLIPISIFILLLFSCTEKDETTSYQIINNKSYNPSDNNYYDNTIWELAVDYYNGYDLIHTDSIYKISPNGGKSDVKIIDPLCETIQVSFRYVPRESVTYFITDRWYIKTIKTIEKGKNNIITVENDTQVFTYSNSTNFLQL